MNSVCSASSQFNFFCFQSFFFFGISRLCFNLFKFLKKRSFFTWIFLMCGTSRVCFASIFLISLKSRIHFHLFKFIKKQSLLSFDLSKVGNKQSLHRFNLSYFLNNQRPLCFDLFKFLNKQKLLGFDLLKILNKQSSFCFDIKKNAKIKASFHFVSILLTLLMCRFIDSCWTNVTYQSDCKYNLICNKKYCSDLKYKPMKRDKQK